MNWKVKYLIPIIFFGVATFILVYKIGKYKWLLKHGKRVSAQIIHFPEDNMDTFPKIYCYNPMQHIQKNDKRDITEVRCAICDAEKGQQYYFRDYFVNPLASRRDMKIYKHERSFTEVENVEIIINPKNYQQYEIMYCDLIEDKYLNDKNALIGTALAIFIPIIIYTKYLMKNIYK